MSETESVIKEKLNGRLHWSNLAFALMPKFKPIVTIREGNIRIPIINVSNSLFFQSAVKWLNENIENI